MRVFVTGGTGFIGSAVVKELLDAGHQVIGLARSDKSADQLKAAGAEVYRGTIDDLDGLKKGAAAADGVVHLAFNNFGDFVESCRQDRLVIEAFGDALAGSNKPLVVTSATGLVVFGQLATEDSKPDPTSFGGTTRGLSEPVALSLASKGVRSSVVRLAVTNHGKGDTVFMPVVVRTAREKGFSAYVGDGTNRWPAVHRLDTARLFRLVLEKGTAGKVYHSVAEEGVPFKTIAEAIGKQLGVPVKSITREESSEHFGFLANFVGMDNPVSSQKTREELGWNPDHPKLIEELDSGVYTSN